MDPVVPPDLQAAFDRERRDARAVQPRDAAAFRGVTVAMYGRLAELQASTVARENVTLGCHRGCDYCCHLRVEVRPHEAFVLAHHIATRFTPAQREELEARLEATMKRIEPLTIEEHRRSGIRCAMLENGVCSAYEARPAACRKYHSVSVKTCRDAYNDPAAPLTGPLEHDHVRLAGNAVALGFAKGREEAGYDTTLYELHAALRHALAGTLAERRYRAKKRPFV